MANTDTTNQVVSKISDAITQLTQVMSNHAPQAWALVVQGAYANAVANLITGGILFLIAVPLGLAAFFCARCAAHELEKPYYEQNDGVMPIVFGAISFLIAGLFVAAAAFSHILDVHSWSMIFAPQGTVAHDLLMKAL